MPTIDTFLPQSIQTIFFSGYTIFNTIVYGIILIIVLFGIIKLFEKLKINPSSIVFSLIPFIVLGSCIRALVDNGIYPKTVFLITPGLYILVGISAILSLIFSVYLYREKGIDYRYTIAIIGLVLAIPNLLLIPHINPIAIFCVLIIWSILTLIFYFIGQVWPLFKDKLNLAIISVHLFDASSTFVAVDFFNYDEQHVLANSIYGLGHTSATMFPMKIIIITLALYLIDEYFDDDNLKGLLKLTVFVLGLAPGLRNFLTIAIGTF